MNDQMIGSKFNMLTVIERVDNSKGGKNRYLCECECGKGTHVSGTNLRNGSVKSCGCIVGQHKIHGGVGTHEYSVWEGMKRRCHSKKDKSYPNYGGRGITVCLSWRHDFTAFLRDMGKAPSSGHSIDRIDNDKGYEPSNCRWATKQEQCQNRRMRTDNKSGVKGVTYRADRREWEATWQESCGKSKSKTFRVSKYGFKKAFELACEVRKNAIAELVANGAKYTGTLG